MSISDDGLERLTRIQQLRESGAITDQEFETMKQSILDPVAQQEEPQSKAVAAPAVDVISDIFWKLAVDADEAHRQIAAAAPSVGLKFDIIRSLDGTSEFLFRGKLLRHNIYKLSVGLTPNGSGTDVMFAVEQNGIVEIRRYTVSLLKDVQGPLLEALRSNG